MSANPFAVPVLGTGAEPIETAAETDPIAAAMLQFRDAALGVADWRKRLADARAELDAVREKISIAEDAFGDAHCTLSKASNELGAALTGGLFEARSIFL